MIPAVSNSNGVNFNAVMVEAVSDNTDVSNSNGVNFNSIANGLLSWVNPFQTPTE